MMVSLQPRSGLYLFRLHLSGDWLIPLGLTATKPRSWAVFTCTIKTNQIRPGSSENICCAARRTYCALDGADGQRDIEDPIAIPLTIRVSASSYTGPGGNAELLWRNVLPSSLMQARFYLRRV